MKQGRLDIDRAAPFLTLIPFLFPVTQKKPCSFLLYGRAAGLFSLKTAFISQKERSRRIPHR